MYRVLTQTIPCLSGSMWHHATDPDNRWQEDSPATTGSGETPHSQAYTGRGTTYTQTARQAGGSHHRL